LPDRLRAYFIVK